MASASVVVGWVLGISNTAMTPPSTAAREPVSRSSFHSSPGSRKWTCVSITPGMTVRPEASNPSPADAWERSPTATILPPRTPTSAGPRPAWFTTSPPRTIRSKASAMLVPLAGLGGRGLGLLGLSLRRLGGFGLGEELAGCGGDAGGRKVLHVADRHAEAGVQGLEA